MLTPDFIIDVEWDRAEKYLFRGRPDSENGNLLDGVYVHSMGSLADAAWPYLDPPLPPYVLSPLRNRFVGLHGAAVHTPQNAVVLLLGHRGSGKTTLTRYLVNNHKCGALTDESIFLHSRTRLVEPFPQPLGILHDPADSMSKYTVRSDKILQSLYSQAALATHLVFLAPSLPSLQLSPIGSNAAFQRLRTHYRAVGSTPDEAIVTMWQLAMDLPAVELSYSNFMQLNASSEKIIEFLEKL